MCSDLWDCLPCAGNESKKENCFIMTIGGLFPAAVATVLGFYYSWPKTI